MYITGQYVITLEADNYRGKVTKPGSVGQIQKVTKDGFQRPILEVQFVGELALTPIRPEKVAPFQPS